MLDHSNWEITENKFISLLQLPFVDGNDTPKCSVPATSPFIEHSNELQAPPHCRTTCPMEMRIRDIIKMSHIHACYLQCAIHWGDIGIRRLMAFGRRNSYSVVELN